ncbi:hypothetical protein FPQ18DRAFT_342215 [Pyronema domesticum]|nr:hypothetical protein FPQ18DRAFT_342215 [Pyronema domesticum]
MVVGDRIYISDGAKVNLDYATIKVDRDLDVSGGIFNAYRGSISLAIGRGHADIVQLLLDNKVNANYDLPGAMVVGGEIYISDGAEVNLDYATMEMKEDIEVTGARCIAYKGPLVGAAWRGQNEIVQRLLAAGARDNFPDGGEPNSSGETDSSTGYFVFESAIAAARTMGHQELSELISAHESRLGPERQIFSGGPEVVPEVVRIQELSDDTEEVQMSEEPDQTGVVNSMPGDSVGR